MAVKLQQGQVWKQGKEYIRIVRLERLEVEYKSLTSLASKAGTKTITSKKDFCRLLKGAHLLSAGKNLRWQSNFGTGIARPARCHCLGCTGKMSPAP